MQIVRPLRHKISAIRAAAESLRLWVMAALAWFAAWGGDREARLETRADLRDARRRAREIFCLAVAAQMTFHAPQGRRIGGRPFGAAPGFRYRGRRFNAIRLMTRGLKLKTLADIRRALDRFDATVARLFARVPKRTRSGGLVLLRAHDALMRVALDVNADAPDTS